ELFFVALYILNTYHTPLLNLRSLPPSLQETIRTLPPVVAKWVATVSWPQVLAICTFPIMAGKQIINGVQFWKAAKLLTESDQEDRWEAKFGKKQ
ncbi:hypothetical protein JCM5350_001090, partial [Sporobolomyces pararoseus]